jgi:DNA polymerase III delta prime subunit
LTIAEYLDDLDGVFNFTEKVLEAFNDDDLEEFDNALKIKPGWGQLYDIEQMMEHAIVHILRHRRQIEKFKVQLTS